VSPYKVLVLMCACSNTLRTTGAVTSAWSELWETKEDHFWDRGYPSPALIEYLESSNPVTRTIKTDGARLKALVPVSSPLLLRNKP